MHRRWLPVVLALLVPVVACSPPAQTGEPTADLQEVAQPRLPRAGLPDGSTVTLELAMTPEEIANGLMFRPSLPPDRGMLFLFEAERVPSFWMKNTLIPLDLVFLDGSGRIVDIIANARPCAADPCPQYIPEAPARAVLEVVAGTVAAHRLEPGQVVEFHQVPGYPIAGDR